MDVQNEVGTRLLGGSKYEPNFRLQLRWNEHRSLRFKVFLVVRLIPDSFRWDRVGGLRFTLKYIPHTYERYLGPDKREFLHRWLFCLFLCLWDPQTTTCLKYYGRQSTLRGSGSRQTRQTRGRCGPNLSLFLVPGDDDCRDYTWLQLLECGSSRLAGVGLGWRSQPNFSSVTVK